MKKYTHAWIAFKAVERLAKVQLADANKPFADYLINWFEDHKDGVIRGAWYPDEIIKDNSTSHVLKHKPLNETPLAFRVLPSTSLLYILGKTSPLRGKAYTLGASGNLPDRCEALSHSVIDNLRIREREDKGSSLTPTDNHIALILFMLSHYIADAHMPMHCDARKDDFLGFNLHAEAEQLWEEDVVRSYEIDRFHQRFRYNPQGFPLLKNDPSHATSILKSVEDELNAREFQIGYGQHNDNVREYITAVCQHSYLLSYAWLPKDVTPAVFDRPALQTAGALPFRDMSIAALSDAVDAVARVWLRDLRRYMKWEKEQI
ncbi:MAG: hypothetical protein C0401_03845 [Anaerolinea sp.]|nr:hypothetical protein [Anaerolinea sp.]